MTRSELIAAMVAAHSTLPSREVEQAVTLFFDEIGDALARGDRVELRGFGTFTVKHREARQGRNPKTGGVVSVAEKRVPFFKAGKDIRQRVDSSNPAAE